MCKNEIVMRNKNLQLQIRGSIKLIFFLFFLQKMYVVHGYSVEAHREHMFSLRYKKKYQYALFDESTLSGASNEYPQHMFHRKVRKIPIQTTRFIPTKFVIMTI